MTFPCENAGAAPFVHSVVAGALVMAASAAHAADGERVTMEFADSFLACYQPSGFSDPNCRPVWNKIAERQPAELAAGVPADAGRTFDGSPADCSFMALNNNGSMFEAINMLDYRRADGSYAEVPAEKFTSMQRAYDFAVEHDLWPKFQTYYQRIMSCSEG